MHPARLSRQGDRVRPTDALRILADGYSLSILAGTLRQEKTAVEISARFGIPIAVAYRRVAELVNAGVLEAAGQALTRDAKRIWMYRSRIMKARAEFDGQALHVNFTDREGKTDNFGGPWTVQEVAGAPTPWEVERTRKGSSLYFPQAAPRPAIGETGGPAPSPGGGGGQ